MISLHKSEVVNRKTNNYNSKQYEQSTAQKAKN